MRTAEIVLDVGIAKSKKAGIAVMYQAIQGKLGGIFPAQYRVWWVAGREESMSYGPVEFAEKFVKVRQYKTVT